VERKMHLSHTIWSLESQFMEKREYLWRYTRVLSSMIIFIVKNEVVINVPAVIY